MSQHQWECTAPENGHYRWTCKNCVESVPYPCPPECEYLFKTKCHGAEAQPKPDSEAKLVEVYIYACGCKSNVPWKQCQKHHGSKCLGVKGEAVERVQPEPVTTNQAYNGNPLYKAEPAKYDRDKVRQAERDLEAEGDNRFVPFTSVEPQVEPSREDNPFGLLGPELDGAIRCRCGMGLIPEGFGQRNYQKSVRVHWYWMTHGKEECSLELPDITCWCGLKRSEHKFGHAKVALPV